MFLLVSVRHVGAHPDEQQHDVSMINLGKTFFTDISYTKYSFDLNLGEGLCIWTFFHFPDSGLYLFNGSYFYFDLFWMAWHWKPSIPGSVLLVVVKWLHSANGLHLYSVCETKWIRVKVCLQGERVTVTSGLNLALVYKQISQVGLPYHPGQLYQLCWRVSSCVTFFITSKICKNTWSSLLKHAEFTKKRENIIILCRKYPVLFRC